MTSSFSGRRRIQLFSEVEDKRLRDIGGQKAYMGADRGIIQSEVR